VSTPEHPTNDRGAATTAIHGGEKRPRAGNSITTPIYQTATYVFRDTAELVDYMSGNTEREEYGRYGNPTQRIAEQKCAAIEGAEAGLAFASGMAAITTTLLAILQSGQHVVLTDDCYRRTRQFCRTVLAKFGVDVTIVETGNDAALEAAITPRTRVLISESPTNPYNKIVDLARIAQIGRKHRVLTIIDSTLGTPVNQRPIEHGIDLVLHSATKFLAGHNDVLGGIILGNESVIEGIRQYQGILGAILDPHAAYLLIRGLKTLPIRVERHNQSAQRIAEMLESHPRVERVHYAGLPSHPGHEIARRQMKGFGGVVSFEVKGDLDAASRVVDAVKIPQIAPSMGGVETLIEQPSLMSFFELTTEERLAVGIKDNLIRLSVGLEDPDDLIADLRQALGRV
jgi:cystathionine gamma-synthase